MKKLVAIILCLLSFNCMAREVEGVKVAENITIGSDTLILNGAGIRSKFFVSVYVGSLYLQRKVRSTAEVLAMPGAKRVSMHFLYDEVSKEKLIDGWNDGFEANNDEQGMVSLKSRLQEFNSLFQTVHKGDVVRLDYVPVSGTVVSMNNKKLGTIEGEDFYKAVLKVWLGEVPADYALKDAMLGED